MSEHPYQDEDRQKAELIENSEYLYIQLKSLVSLLYITINLPKLHEYFITPWSARFANGSLFNFRFFRLISEPGIQRHSA